ncbi:MAG: acyl--CoA ligase, partial [Candidatus Krumholzibacteria bacterium]|nr:acyl--CoA ligase [Candidatus Krumholzibacteria bacterium]
MEKTHEHMLFDHLQRLATKHGRSHALVAGENRVTFAELSPRAERWVDTLTRFHKRRLGLAIRDIGSWIAAAAACDKLGISLFLIDPELDSRHRLEFSRFAGLSAVLVDDAAQPVVECGDLEEVPHEGEAVVTIVTSGTTGKPKPVRHTWRSLSRPVRIDQKYERTRWFLSYPLRLYAGLQVFLQCFLNAGTLVVAPGTLGQRELVTYLLTSGVDYVSGTPSFWRGLLSFGDRSALRQLKVQQVTLGGEPATGDLLSTLHDVLPKARIVHIYATSELGRCFTVTDCRPGFPVDYLRKSPEPGIDLRIHDGELQVRSSNSMKGYDRVSELKADMGDWFPTGDLVEVVGDRVEFRGRKTEMINVGGNKVFPLEVESVLRTIPEVVDARVYAVASSLVGEVVGADIVLDKMHSPDAS